MTETLENSTKWGFLLSRKFWALVLFGLSHWLFQDGFISEALSNFIQIIAGGFIGINMIDKFIGTLK